MSTQNAAKADSVRLEDEISVLNRYTDLCIRKKDRGKEVRQDIERRRFGDRNPEIQRYDVLIEDEKTMEDMLQLYMKKDKLLKQLIEGMENYMDEEIMMSNIMKSALSELKCDCLDHILPTCEYHNAIRKV